MHSDIMPIYLIKNREDLPKGKKDPWDPWFDTCSAMVVVAKSEEEVRELASNNHFDEGSGCWKDPLYTSCEIIDQEITRIILQDVQWG